MPSRTPRRTSAHGRPRRSKHNPGRQSMTYGTLPEFPVFKAYVENRHDDDDEAFVIGPSGDVYHMELVGHDVTAAKAALKILFSSGARVNFEQFEGEHKKFGLRFLDLVSLHKFLLALITIYEMEGPEKVGPDEGGGDRGDVGEVAADLASSIMSTLGYEWV